MGSLAAPRMLRAAADDVIITEDKGFVPLFEDDIVVIVVIIFVNFTFYAPNGRIGVHKS